MSCDVHAEARYWLARYATGRYSPEMTDAEVETAVAEVAEIIASAFQAAVGEAWKKQSGAKGIGG